MLAISFPVLSTTAFNCCPVDTSSSKMACQHTQLMPCRTGSEPTAQISLPKTSGLQIYPTWAHWITCLGQCWRPMTSTIRNRKQLPNWMNAFRWSGTAYLRDQWTKLSRSSQSYWRPVLQQRVDILNTHSNCNVQSWLCYFFAWMMLF